MNGFFYELRVELAKLIFQNLNENSKIEFVKESEVLNSNSNEIVCVVTNFDNEGQKTNKQILKYNPNFVLGLNEKEMILFREHPKDYNFKKAEKEAAKKIVRIFNEVREPLDLSLEAMKEKLSKEAVIELKKACFAIQGIEFDEIIME